MILKFLKNVLIGICCNFVSRSCNNDLAIEKGFILLFNEALDGVRAGPADDLGSHRVHVLQHADAATGTLAAAPLEAAVDHGCLRRTVVKVIKLISSVTRAK